MTSNHDIVASHYAASARGDIDGMLSVLAPDAQWTEMAGSAYAGTYIGREAVLEGVFRRIGEDFSEFSFELERLLDAGEHVVALGHYRARSRATGKPLRCRAAHVWRLASGRVAAFEQIADTLLIDRALG